MAYLGNVPARSFISFERQVFTIVNSQTAYTLSHSVTNENDIRLVVNNIVQEPGSGKAYTASGTTLTLSAALTNGTDEMYCVFLGRAVGTVNAPAGSVGNSQTAATIVTGQTAEATVADDDLVLLSDTSASAALKKMTVANLTANAGTAGLTSSSGNITITDGDLIFGGAGHGVYLGVTSATAANHLDDYEEGSFTPAYAFDSGSVAMRSGSRGEYVKVGNLVHFNLFMSTDSISSPSGDATITGLPFTVGDENSSSATIGLLYRFGTDFGGELKVRIGQDSVVLSPFKNTSNSTSATRFQGSDFTSGGAYNNIHVAGCYSTR